jgi:broad specificity phosphatase PhoE
LRESNEAIRKRVNEFKKELLKILESDEDSPIVITAHSRSIRELVRALLNKKDRRKVMLAPKHASINCIEFDGQNFSYSKEN